MRRNKDSDIRFPKANDKIWREHSVLFVTTNYSVLGLYRTLDVKSALDSKLPLSTMRLQTSGSRLGILWQFSMIAGMPIARASQPSTGKQQKATPKLYQFLWAKKWAKRE